MNLIILESNQSGNDCLRGFLRLARREYEADGHRVHVLELTEQDSLARLPQIVSQERPEFALCMSGVGSDIYSREGRLFWEDVKLPLFSWNCDHPAYATSRRTPRNPYVIHGYVFPDHARFAVEQLRASSAAFAVHMGIPDRAAFAGAPLPLDRRNGRLLFAKTGSDHRAIEARWRTFAAPFREILFAVADAAQHANASRMIELLRDVAPAYGVYLDPANPLRLLLIRELDNYLRSRRANVVMEAVLDYPVDVYGSGWDHLDWNDRGARALGPAPWSRIVEAFPGYIGAVSINPFVEESIHDRSFYALAANVVPIADSNEFSRARMSELEDFAFGFDRDSVRGAVERLLADVPDALARTESCRQRLDPEFSMRTSVRRIAACARVAFSNTLVAA